jgi:hypothetical protein
MEGGRFSGAGVTPVATPGRTSRGAIFRDPLDRRATTLGGGPLYRTDIASRAASPIRFLIEI